MAFCLGWSNSQQYRMRVSVSGPPTNEEDSQKGTLSHDLELSAHEGEKAVGEGAETGEIRRSQPAKVVMKSGPNAREGVTAPEGASPARTRRVHSTAVRTVS